MKDILDNPIESGKIIAYARRVNGKQTLGFGIVLNTNAKYGNEKRIRIIPLETYSVPANLFKVHLTYMSDTPTTMIDKNQVWVLEDTSVLPDGLVEALKRAYELHHARLTSAEKERTVTKDMTPNERYLHYVNQNSGNSEFEEMQKSIMNV